MQTFRVSAWDLNTNELLTDLAATNVKYSVRMNDAGEFSFQLSLTDPKIKELTAVILGLRGVPFKVLITTNKNQTILYAGIAWHTDLKVTAPFLTVSGKALPSYFTQVCAAKAYTTAIQPTLLLAAVVADVQAQKGYNIGINTRYQVSVPPAQITPAYAKSQHVIAAQIVADITAAIVPGTGGVDYSMEHTFVNGAPRHTLVIAAPRCGQDRTTSQAGINLDSATDWSWPIENTTSGNHVIVVGAGSGAVQPEADGYVSTPVGGRGQPPGMDLVLSYNQIGKQNQLQALANGNVQMFGQPVATPTVTFPVDYEPLKLGDFTIGQDVKVTAAPSIWFPWGLSEWWRIAAYTVEIADAGVSTYTLTLNRPPVF